MKKITSYALLIAMIVTSFTTVWADTGLKVDESGRTVLELKEITQLTSVGITWENPVQNEYRFLIEVSDDSMNYKGIMETMSYDKDEQQVFSIQGYSGKYLRLTSTGETKLEIKNIDINVPVPNVLTDNAEESNIPAVKSVAYDFLPKGIGFSDVIGTKYEKYVGLISALGIITGNDGAFSPEGNISLRDFTAAVLRMTGVYNISNAEETAEVDLDAFCSGGDTFYNYAESFLESSNKAVTYYQAVRIICSALGADRIAASKGEYPSGYEALALEMGYSDNVVSGYSEPLSRGNAAILIYNALHEKMIIDGDDNDNHQTPLEKYLGIKSDKGIVMSTQNLSLNGGKMLKPALSINGIEYRIENTEYESCIGCNVKYYYDQIYGDQRIVYLEPEKNEIIRVDGDKINSCDIKDTAADIVYESENGRERHIKTDKPVFVYNGRTAELCDSDIEGLDLGSTLTAIDNDGNGFADVIFIYEYKDAVVREVQAEKEKIFFKSSDMGKELDLEDKEYVVYKNGSAVALKDLKTGDIISAAVSKDGEYITIQASDIKISGSVAAKLFGDKTTLIISGAELNIRESIKDTVQLGTKGEFFLNVFGVIAYKEAFDEDMKLAILVDMRENEDDESVFVKLYTQAAEFESFTLAEKISYNSKSLDGEKLLASGTLWDASSDSAKWKSRKLIRYYTDSEGKIYKIDTPAKRGVTYEDRPYVIEYEGGTNDYKYGFCGQYVKADVVADGSHIVEIIDKGPRMIYEGSRLFRSINGSYSVNSTTGAYKLNGLAVDYKYSPDTISWVIPPDSDEPYTINESEYSYYDDVKKYYDQYRDKILIYSGYNLTGNSLAECLIAYTKPSISVDTQDKKNTYLVTGVSRAVAPDEDIAYKIDAIYFDQIKSYCGPKTLYVKKEELLNVKAADWKPGDTPTEYTTIKKGDLIKTSDADKYGYIEKIVCIFDAEERYKAFVNEGFAAAAVSGIQTYDTDVKWNQSFVVGKIFFGDIVYIADDKNSLSMNTTYRYYANNGMLEPTEIPLLMEMPYNYGTKDIYEVNMKTGRVTKRAAGDISEGEYLLSFIEGNNSSLLVSVVYVFE